MKTNCRTAAVAGFVCIGASGAAFGAETMHIIATDRGLEAPQTVPAGMRHVVFENRGKHIHEAMLIKLPAEMDAAQFQEQVRQGFLFPDGAKDYSGPGLTSPGETTELWLKLDPGQYVLICWQHMRNSVRGFAVPVGEPVDDVPPPYNAVLKLRDFQFELSGRLRKGVQTLRVENSGPSIHEADLFRLHPGSTAADVQRWYKDDLSGPAPADILGGVLDSHDIKHVVWLRRAFKPGKYVFHCGVPMNLHAKAGDKIPLHADVGMVMTFEISE